MKRSSLFILTGGILLGVGIGGMMQRFAYEIRSERPEPWAAFPHQSITNGCITSNIVILDKQYAIITVDNRTGRTIEWKVIPNKTNQ